MQQPVYRWGCPKCAMFMVIDGICDHCHTESEMPEWLVKVEDGFRGHAPDKVTYYCYDSMLAAVKSFNAYTDWGLALERVVSLISPQGETAQKSFVVPA